MIKSKRELIDSIDISSLPQVEQEEILLDLHETVFRSVLIRLVGSMSESVQDDFNVFLDADPEEEAVLAYIYEKVPEADILVAQTLVDIQNDILGATETK